MPLRTPSLRFDKRNRGWVENPKPWLQELKEKHDEYYAGMLFGMCIEGIFFSVVMALAFLTHLL